MSKGRKTPLDALHFHPPAHPPHVSYLSHYKKGTQHVLYWRWTLALEEDRVRQILSIFISPRDTALHHLSFSRAAPRAWMTIVNASTSDITKLYFRTSVSVSFLTFTSYIWCLNAVFSLRFSTMVVSGSVCSSLRVLACWQWGRECSDMNTSASWLLSALEDNPPTLAMLMQRIWRASASRRSFHATRRTPPSHLCGIVIVFPDIWWCPWQLGGLAWGLLSCPGLGNITGWDVKSLIQTFFLLFSVTWERLSECKAEPMRKKKKRPQAIFGVADWERKLWDRFHTVFKSFSSCFLCSHAQHLLQTARLFFLFLSFWELPVSWTLFYPLSSIISSHCAHEMTDISGRPGWLEAEPVPSSSRSRLPCQNHSQFL